MRSVQNISRRKVLRGTVGGISAAVGLPFLDCFLNSHGTALANGTELPVGFATWFWGLGFNPGRWEPKVVGANYEMGPELQALTPFKHKINIYSGLKIFLDGKPLVVHNGVGTMQGGVPAVSGALPSIDSLVADAIGSSTSFRSLEVACDGRAQSSYSRRSASVSNPAEPSPVALYTRIFGPDFRDPNAADFKPDPRVMLKRSALSAVSEQRKDFARNLGADDRARLDQYFTSLRELEQKLELQLQKPAPLEACTTPNAPEKLPTGSTVEQTMNNHKLFALLLAHALACGQTRVVNLVLSPGVSIIQKEGNSMNHHMHSHEEPVDAELGYQREFTYFVMQCVDSFRDFVAALDGIREGDRTLLDRMLVYTATDTGYAKHHSVENIPMMTAGGANGRIKTGIHVAAAGDPLTRVGLTVQQALGVSTGSWGTLSNQTSKPFAEVMA